MPQPTWVTPAGNFGTYTEGVPITKTFTATPSTGGWTLVYTILNGVFPDAIVPFTLSNGTGQLTGTPAEVPTTEEYTFTIRVDQYNGTVYEGSADRTFSFYVQGVTPPTFVTPTGPLYPGPGYLPDSTWNPFQVVVNNPDPSADAIIRLINGNLPPGLEINDSGLIRGYADPSNSNYAFTLSVESQSGSSTRNFQIQVVQQTAGTRAPAILNTRPPSYTIEDSDPGAPYYIGSDGYIGIFSQDNYFIYRILGTSFSSGCISYLRTGTLPPGVQDSTTYNSNTVAISVIDGGSGYLPGDNLKILGSQLGGVDIVNDMDFVVDTVDSGKLLTVTGISGLNVDSGELYTPVAPQTITGTGSGAQLKVSKLDAGWLFGTIAINSSLLVNTYNFTYVAINNNNLLTSDPIGFSMVVVAQNNNIPFNVSVNWTSDTNIGVINNGEISTLYVEAVQAGGLPLTYTLTSGSLPPDLTLESNGEIWGRVAFEPLVSTSPAGTSTDYTFTVTAVNVDYPEITSTKTFTITVYQKFDQPYDNLYIKALLPIDSRMVLNSLLQDTFLIPLEWLYRPLDVYFGRATEIIYQHMYGVPSSSVAEYITAVEKNHYRRNLVLGPLKTAVAKDVDGNIIYEVVYSEIIDNLINKNGVSISKQITWPVSIPGSSRTLYPNSLPNMRQQIADAIGQDTQSALLPKWMITQQADGQILGFTPAWVICYTKPGYSEIIKNNIVSPLPGPVIVSKSTASGNTFECITTAGFYPGMRVKFTGTAFGGITTDVNYLIYSIESETLFTITTSMLTGQIELSNGSGEMLLHHVTWDHTLNEFDFAIDRFEVGKSLTYDYDTTTDSWTALPSGVDPTDSNDEYIYFNKNILGNS